MVFTVFSERKSSAPISRWERSLASSRRTPQLGRRSAARRRHGVARACRSRSSPPDLGGQRGQPAGVGERRQAARARPRARRRRAAAAPGRCDVRELEPRRGGRRARRARRAPQRLGALASRSASAQLVAARERVTASASRPITGRDDPVSAVDLAARARAARLSSAASSRPSSTRRSACTAWAITWPCGRVGASGRASASSASFAAPAPQLPRGAAVAARRRARPVDSATAVGRARRRAGELDRRRRDRRRASAAAISAERGLEVAVPPLGRQLASRALRQRDVPAARVRGPAASSPAAWRSAAAARAARSSSLGQLASQPSSVASLARADQAEVLLAEQLARRATARRALALVERLLDQPPLGGTTPQRARGSARPRSGSTRRSSSSQHLAEELVVAVPLAARVERRSGTGSSARGRAAARPSRRAAEHGVAEPAAEPAEHGGAQQELARSPVERVEHLARR